MLRSSREGDHKAVHGMMGEAGIEPTKKGNTHTIR